MNNRITFLLFDYDSNDMVLGAQRAVLFVCGGVEGGGRGYSTNSLLGASVARGPDWPSGKAFGW